MIITYLKSSKVEFGCKIKGKISCTQTAAQKFEGERFNLRKLKELEVKEKYQIEIT